VKTLVLTLTLSPEEREQRAECPGDSNNGCTIAAFESLKVGETFTLVLGRGPG